MIVHTIYLLGKKIHLREVGALRCVGRSLSDVYIAESMPIFMTSLRDSTTEL